MSQAKLPFEFPETLQDYAITVSEYMGQHKQFHQLCVGAIIFREDRLLLVQRAATERAFPNLWEIPGGKCEDEDETILHGVAREVKEETGLDVKKVVRKCGQFDWADRLPHGGEPERWVKLIFEVEVEKADRIVLDPTEHQKHLWCTEKEIEQDKAGDTAFAWISLPNKTVNLEAFKLRDVEESGMSNKLQADWSGVHGEE